MLSDQCGYVSKTVWDSLWSRTVEITDRVGYHLHRTDMRSWVIRPDEVVYMAKRRGLSTEAWGTPVLRQKTCWCLWNLIFQIKVMGFHPCRYVRETYSCRVVSPHNIRRSSQQLHSYSLSWFAATPTFHEMNPVPFHLIICLFGCQSFFLHVLSIYCRTCITCIHANLYIYPNNCCPLCHSWHI